MNRSLLAESQDKTTAPSGVIRILLDDLTALESLLKLFNIDHIQFTLPLSMSGEFVLPFGNKLSYMMNIQR